MTLVGKTKGIPSVAVILDRSPAAQRGTSSRQPPLYKHLRFAGVTVVMLAEGEISEIHSGSRER